MVKEKQRKVVKYRKLRNLNAGMIVFTIIFVHMFFSASTYLRKEKVQFYRVTEGPIVSDGTYTGLTIGEENTEYAASSGNIDRYIRKGKRTAVGTSTYSIDESGTLFRVPADNTSTDLNLAGAGLVGIKKQLTSSSMTYRDKSFNSVYDVKYSLEAAVLEYVNFNALDNLEQLMETIGVNFTQAWASEPRVIGYAINPFEDFNISQISEAAFDRTNYSRAITKSGKLVEKEIPAYKIVTDEDRSSVFPMSEQGVASYGTQASFKIFLPAESLTRWGDFSMLTRTDARPYSRPDFNRYMVQFVTGRYLDFETISSRVEGLKMPVSPVTNENLYLVPVDYLTTGGDSTNNGFYKEVYSESGTDIVFIPVTLYDSTEEYHRVDIGDEESDLKARDYIVEPDPPTERYQVGTTSSLQDIYNINRGYTVFKQTVMLAQNDEYYIVERGVSYDLSVYDHVVMDAFLIESEGVLIYQ